MFGIGGGEFAVLAVIALLVLGPEKLPRYAADAAKMLREVRVLLTRARAEVADQLGPEFADISLTDLNPRTLITRHVFDGDEDPLGLRDDRTARPAHNGARTGGPQHSSGDTPRHTPGETPPYDTDAT